MWEPGSWESMDALLPRTPPQTTPGPRHRSWACGWALTVSPFLLGQVMGGPDVETSAGAACDPLSSASPQFAGITEPPQNSVHPV